MIVKVKDWLALSPLDKHVYLLDTAIENRQKQKAASAKATA